MAGAMPEQPDLEQPQSAQPGPERSGYARFRYLRRMLEDSFRQIALSVDGHEFTYQAPLLAERMPIGSYITIHADERCTYLAQIIGQEVVVERAGQYETRLAAADLAVMDGMDGEGMDSAQVAAQLTMRVLRGHGTLIAAFTDGALDPSRPLAPFKDAPFGPAPHAYVEQFQSAIFQGPGALEMGVLRDGQPAVPAHLAAKGFNRHTFLCGQSGSGKTFSLGVILEQLLLETSLRIIILDPNSDFVKLNQIHDLEQVNRTRALPLSPGAYARRDAAFRSVHPQIRIFRPPSALTAGQDDVVNAERLQIHLSDLDADAQATLLQLDPLADRTEFHMFRETLDQLGGRSFTANDLQALLANNFREEARSLAMRLFNLRIGEWEIWAPQQEAPSFLDVLDDDWRCLVVDIGALGSTIERTTVTEALLGRLWARRNHREPLLVVMDEAHNICPTEPGATMTQLTTDETIRIAGEGRKFGLYLLLASQRPSKLHPNVISQCENLLLMRMNSRTDLAHMQTIFSHVPAPLMGLATGFRQGESLAAGRIVPHPTLLRVGGRFSREGGSDIPADWAAGQWSDGDLT